MPTSRSPRTPATNPFVAGASRVEAKRDYTVLVDFGPVPEKRAPNTLYTGTGQTAAPNLNGTFILRTDIPDRGQSEPGPLERRSSDRRCSFGNGPPRRDDRDRDVSPTPS